MCTISTCLHALSIALKRLTKEVMIKKNQTEHLIAEREILSESNSNGSIISDLPSNLEDISNTMMHGNHNQWLVQLYYSFQDNHSLYMVMDYLPGTLLFSIFVYCACCACFSRIYVAISLYVLICRG